MTTTSISELAPCPFCGGEPLLENTITQASVMCCDCPAVMRRDHTTRSFDDGTHRVLAAWNTRSIPTAAPDDAAVERVARAIWVGAGFKPSIWDKTEGASWAQYMDDQRPKWLGYAHAAIAALIEKEEGSNHG